MDRRNAVKNLVVAYGGLITLPFWMQACGISDQQTHPSSFSAEEQGLLAKITDTIIPAGNSIGALTAGVDRFLQKIIDDCYEKPVQENVKKQLHGLEDSAKKEFGSSFISCSQKQRKELLEKWAVSADKSQKDFFDLMRSETIHGFTTSQEVLEKYLDYKIAPGHYFGCVNLNA
ncbi:MAG: gluconate 2-dehydrogenase subunit 3 family protein [Chitinophagales bacterium]